jgi:hypothetical protein
MRSCPKILMGLVGCVELADGLGEVGQRSHIFVLLVRAIQGVATTAVFLSPAAVSDPRVPGLRSRESADVTPLCG